MTDRAGDIGPDPQPSLAEELGAIPYEPPLPVEKWLIASSLLLGVALLGLLLWISATYFPVGPSSSPAPPAPAARPKS